MTTKAVFVTEEGLLEFLGTNMPKNVAKKTPLEKDSDGELKISMAGKIRLDTHGQYQRAECQELSGGNVDYHTDIFSLGCVIDRLSPAYAKVARKCCQRDPSRRYQSALEVKEAIKHISRLPWGLAMAAILATILSVTLYLAHPGDVHERVSDVKATYSDSSHSGTGKQSGDLDVPARHIPDSSAKTQVKPSHSQSAASPKKPAKEASPARDPHSDRAAIDELFRQATELFDQ